LRSVSFLLVIEPVKLPLHAKRQLLDGGCQVHSGGNLLELLDLDSLFLDKVEQRRRRGFLLGHFAVNDAVHEVIVREFY
jgi:hypothetical protein